jgi:hypothetical protein
LASSPNRPRRRRSRRRLFPGWLVQANLSAIATRETAEDDDEKD